MKNLFRVLAAAALIVLAASCARETNSDSISDYFRKYNLSFSEATKTELSGTGNKRHVNWGEGDEIKYYTVSKQASAASATVNVSGSSAYVEIPRGRSDEFINAVYGASQLKSSSSTADVMYISSPIKNAQSYKSFSAAHVCVAFSDDIEAPNLSFHNIPAVFKFTSVASISKVVFYGNKDEIINAGKNGDLKITSSGGALSVESAATGSNASNQTSVTVATKGAVADFFIAILPVNFSAGITVDCYDTDSELVFSLKTTGALNTVSGSGAPKILDLGNAQDWIASAPPTAVDLGLSVKWASFNVGATSPDGYGDYFAWGETAPKAEYKWVNYQLGSSKNGPFSKYVLDAQYGTVDHKTVLDLSDDAAYVAWGGDWRMPTKEEWDELKNSSNCSWTWTTKNGIKGYKVTSKKSGFTGNSIFLPANGYFSGTSVSEIGTSGNYWASSISDSYTYFAISPYFTSSSIKLDNCNRYSGLAVRPVYSAVVPVSSIEIPESLTLLVGASETLSASVLPENATYKNLTWASSDASIVTVDANGKVTAVAPGTATIIAYSADGGITATCVVSSIKLAESVTLDKTAIEMYVGDEPITLTATILPETNTEKTVSWTSSKTSVATVDEEGRVTAVANGTATITATAKDGSGKSATCSVTVKTHVESVSLDKTELTFYKGKTATLTATVTPSTAYDKSVIWSSSDASVASVNQDGKVTGVSVGSATITVYSADASKTATCKVSVIEPLKPETVDLGLSVKWASWNLGAFAPEEYGDYFAWGETQPKDNYKWSTYKWFNRDDNKLTKYCTLSSCWDSTEPMDNKMVLDPEDDAAHVNWGGSWRMPTDAEWTELRENCTWTWTTQNGVDGRLVKSKTNSNSIFLPSAGYRDFTSLDDAGSGGYYWSSSLYTDGPYFAWYVYFNSGDVDRSGRYRNYGFSVRPVYGDRIPPESVSLNKTELTLYKGKTATLTATVTPSTAADKSVVWSSSDASVATVDQDGKVTGVKVGTAVITVTTVDGGYSASCPVSIIDPPEFVAVDLGLSVKWATFNVGATKPEEYGDYFAWGETQPKDNYNWSTYKFGTSSSGPFFKYNTSNSYGTVDNKTVLDPEDDAAHVNWGGSWRMPTDADWTELRKNCTWTWTTQNGVKGRLVTSKTNGNSIFLPAAGCRYGTNLNNVGSGGYYWSSSLNTDNPYDARYVYFYSDNVSGYNDFRFDGFSVRPVSE